MVLSTEIDDVNLRGKKIDVKNSDDANENEKIYRSSSHEQHIL